MYSQGTPETPTFKDHSFFVSSVWLHVYVMRNLSSDTANISLLYMSKLFFPWFQQVTLTNTYKASAFLAANPKRR